MPSRRSMVFWKYMFSDSCFCALDLCFSCNFQDLGIRHVKINLIYSLQPRRSHDFF